MRWVCIRSMALGATHTVSPSPRSRNSNNPAGVNATVAYCGKGSALVSRRGVARLLRLVLVGALIAAVVVATATADSPSCTHGVSSAGPVALTQGQLSGDTEPHTEACLP
jgi:hypothetical protein